MTTIRSASARHRGRRRCVPAATALTAAALAVPALSGAVLLAPAASAQALPSNCTQSGQTVTCTFAPGTGQSFTVPADVSTLSVTLYGAVGGSYPSGATGGDGAEVTADLAVSGGTLGIDVGGAGAAGSSTRGSGGSGGGATDINSGGTDLLVAGGGGGAGASYTEESEVGGTGYCTNGETVTGGAGGNADTAGSPGQNFVGTTKNGDANFTLDGGSGGQPGTTSGAGAGGTSGATSGSCALGSLSTLGPGASGSGQTGGSPGFGGGGGDGYFGGGAGGGGGQELDGAGANYAGGGGGGGGASFGGGTGVSNYSLTDTGNSAQVNSGDGEALISYQQPTAQAIDFTSTPPSPAVVGGTYTPTATGGGSGNPVTFSIDSASTAGACSISNGVVSFTGAGTCTIDANQAGGDGYAAAPQAQQVITIQAPVAQAIDFTSTPPSPAVVGGTYTPTATGGGSGNPVTFSIDSASTAGACSISNGVVSFTGAGTCTIDANQAGGDGYAAAAQAQQVITVDQAPAFTVDSPPTTATAGQVYSYAFVASGTPAPTYALATGAPSWLTVDSSTGTVSGTVPSGTTSFSYSVTATNAAGTATAGPFTVTVSKASTAADLAASLSCPGSLAVGNTGTCTLTVTNHGPAAAKSVIAAIALPPSLGETACSTSCARHANVITWTAASLADGASVTYTVTVKAAAAGKALVLGAAASASPDPDPLNNIALATVTITR